MRTMRFRWLAVALLAIALVVSFVSCQDKTPSGDETDTQTESEGTVTEAPTEEPTEAPTETDLADTEPETTEPEETTEEVTTLRELTW